MRPIASRVRAEQAIPSGSLSLSFLAHGLAFDASPSLPKNRRVHRKCSIDSAPNLLSLPKQLHAVHFCYVLEASLYQLACLCKCLSYFASVV